MNLTFETFITSFVQIGHTSRLNVPACALISFPFVLSTRSFCLPACLPTCRVSRFRMQDTSLNRLIFLEFFCLPPSTPSSINGGAICDTSSEDITVNEPAVTTCQHLTIFTWRRRFDKDVQSLSLVHLRVHNLPTVLFCQGVHPWSDRVSIRFRKSKRSWTENLPENLNPSGPM